MNKNVINFLSREHAGFSGLNHVLIAIGLFVALFFIPFEPFTSFVTHMKQTPLTLAMCFLIICGAALLPDLDHLKSEGGSVASFELRGLGSVLSSLMVTISSIMTSIFHGKKDIRPDTQHRFFWHTLLIPLIIFLLVAIFAPMGDTKVIELFTNMGNGGPLPTSTIVILFLIMICVYLGAAVLLKKLQKILPILPHFNSDLVALIVSLAAMLFCLFMSTETDIRFYGIVVAVGVLMHIIADCIADSGVPLLFPLTGIFGKFWMRIRFLPKAMTIKTGSIIESMMKIVFFVIDIILVYLLFTLVLLV